MTKFTADNLTTLTANEVATVNTLNENFNRLEIALEKTLSRDGTSPNEMNDDLDMNSFRILHLPKAVNPTEPVRKAEFDAATFGGSSNFTSIYQGILDALHTANPVEPQFGAVGDGITNDAAAIQAAVNYLEGLDGGGTLIINHPHRILSGITINSGKVNIWSPNYAGGYLYCVGAFTPVHYQIDSVAEDGAPSIENLGIFRGDSNTNSTAILMESLALLGSGEGEISGAQKGYTISGVRIDTFGETAKEITGATPADPVVITCPNHGYATGDTVSIALVEGMTELNDREYQITVINSNSFSLDGEDGVGYSTYTGAGEVTRESSGYWRKGIEIRQFPHGQIERCWIKGRGGTTTSKSGAGISLGHYSMGTQVFNNTIRGFYGGLHVDDTEFFNIPARANSTSYVYGDIVSVSTNDRYRFMCTTAGVTGGSIPAGYATARRSTEITDGTAVFVALEFQCEGVRFVENKVQACHIGFYSSITNVENTWTIENNDFDVGYSSVYIKNGYRLNIIGNTMGWNNRNLDHVDIYLERTDGADADDAYRVLANIKNNVCYRGGNLDLTVTGISYGATTTISYTKDADKKHPAANEVLFLSRVRGPTQLDDIPFKAGVVTQINDTSGTVTMLDYVSGSAINSTGYAALVGTATVTRYGRFVETGVARGIHVHENVIASRNVGVHLAALTEELTYTENVEATALNKPVYNLSTGYGTHTIRLISEHVYEDGGAIGDGVADDTQNLQAVLTDGRSLRLNPLKTYKITTRLNITEEGTGIEGNKALLYMSTGAGHFDNDDYTLRTGADAVGIYASAVNKAFVKNVVIKPTAWVDARYLKAIFFTDSEDVVIEGNECSDFSRGAGVISISDCPRALIKGNKVYDCRTRSKYESDGSTLITSATMQITGIEVDDGSSTGSIDAKIIENWVWNMTGSNAILTEPTLLNIQTDGINVKGTDGKSKGILIANNHIKNVGEGIDAFTWDSLIVNNYIERAFGAGIKIFHGAQRNHVRTNTIIESGLAAIYTGGTSSTDNNIDRNFATDNIIQYVNRAIDWYEYDGVTKFYTTAAGSTHWTTTRATTTAGIRVDYLTGALSTPGDSKAQATNWTFARNFADLGYTGSGSGANAADYWIFCEAGNNADVTTHEVEDNVVENWKTGKYLDSSNRLWIKPGKVHRIWQTANRSAYTANTSPQTMFDAKTITSGSRGEAGSFNAKPSTAYRFRMRGVFSSLSGSTNSLNFGFGGTATATYVSFEVLGRKGEGSAAAQYERTAVSLSAGQATPNDTQTTAVVKAEGIIVTNAAGTLIPQITQVTNSAAAVLDRGSYFEIWEDDNLMSVSGTFT